MPRKATTNSPSAANTEGLVEIKHSIKEGYISIEDTTYPITNGTVYVRPEHVDRVKNHITMTRK